MTLCATSSGTHSAAFANAYAHVLVDIYRTGEGYLSKVSIVNQALITDSNDDLAGVKVTLANDSLEDLEPEIHDIGLTGG
jgi:hypothetical protein